MAAQEMPGKVARMRAKPVVLVVDSDFGFQASPTVALADAAAVESASSISEALHVLTTKRPALMLLELRRPEVVSLVVTLFRPSRRPHA